MNMSAEQLEHLAAQAAKLAKDLRGQEPTYTLALEAGVVDKSYRTVRYGMVPDYRGEAIITMADGTTWKAVGHGPTGTAEFVAKEGYIEFIPL